MKVFLGIIFLLSVYFVSVAQQINEVTQSESEVLKYSKITFRLEASLNFDDPFNQENVRLDAIVSAPSGDSITVPGFYLNGNADSSEWEVRFTPREVGTYQAYLIIKNQESKLVSEKLYFTVNDSEQKGFLTMNESKVFFQFDSGEKFRGVGTDFGWEAKDFEDQKFTYPYYFEKIEENKGNFTRSWMAPHNLPLEWKDVDNHRYIDDTLRYNTSGINKMDEVLDLAKQYGVYMMIALDFHGELKTQPNYWGGGNFWSSNLYNVDNGGPCDSPADFFSNADAIKRYKDRLRYFIARWGYHTNLGVIEFWNEVDNAMADENIPPEDIVTWHTIMADYLQEIDPYDHIVSTSISHRTINGLFDIENIDFAQAHIYDKNNNLAMTIANLGSTYHKPGVIGEFGYDWTGAPAPIEELAFKNYFRLGLWRGLFSESPILPLTWWWEFFMGSEQFVELERIRTFSDIILKNCNNSLRSAIVTGDGRVEKLALKSDENLFVWLRNQNTINISDVEIDVNSYNITGDIYYTIYDCKKGMFSDIEKISKTDGSTLITLEYLSAQQEIAIFFTTNKIYPVSTFEFQKQTDDIKIFPNPAKEHCIVRVKSERQGQVNLDLLSVEGIIIQSQTHNLDLHTSEFNIPLEEVKNQVCFLRVQSNAGIVTKKIIVKK